MRAGSRREAGLRDLGFSLGESEIAVTQSGIIHD
jgi:hypothetical protein